MAAHNLRVRDQHRDLLRGAGFPFCDDRTQVPDPTLRQPVQELRVASHLDHVQYVLSNGVGASTCDHDSQQNIGTQTTCLCRTTVQKVQG